MNSDFAPRYSRRQILAGSAAVVGGAFWPGEVRAGVVKPQLQVAEAWAPHPKAAAVTAKRGEAFAADANGTRTLSGGWQWRFDGVTAGTTYEISAEASHEDVPVPRDSLICKIIWGVQAADQSRVKAVWDNLVPEVVGAGRVRFSRRLVAPEGVSELTIRASLRWTATGRTLWQMPQVAVASEPLTTRPPVRVCVVTGHEKSRKGPFKTLQDNIKFYGDLCEAACVKHRPQLIVLPEIALQWQVPGGALELAVPAPGPETDAFAAIARRHGVRIALGMYEREDDAVRNSLVLIGPDGTIDGRYHKVHLAAGNEDATGILPGDSFPVFGTEMGRMGCNICMDSSVAESSRMVGLNGADFLLLPIMGDHRADRWDRGTPVYNEDRWRAIMRTHALDNQLCMVVARNDGLGSCVVDRKGDILAWNDGKEDFITADVKLDDGYRIWQGGCFRDVNWMQRRPHLYGPFVDGGNAGSLR